MRKQKLERVLEVRKRAEDARARTLAQARGAHKAARAQLDELSGLAESYRAEHAATPPTSAAVLRQFRQFYGQLRQALDTHDATLDALHQDVLRNQAQFAETFKARKALEKVIERRELVHRKEAKRVERKAIDSLRANPLV